MSEIITWDQLPELYLRKLKPEKRKRANPGRKMKRRYLDLVTAFDIETSRIPGMDESAMYIWQWQFGLDYTVMGRTWDELRFLIRKITDNIPEGSSLVCLVFNLSFEFQFLRGIYNFNKEEVFAIDSRKVLKCEMFNHFELRCSYLQTNMSLDAFTKKMGCEVRKLTGTFDYHKIRYPDTELSEDEIAYCVNDVRSLVEALKIDRSYLYRLFKDKTGVSVSDYITRTRISKAEVLLSNGSLSVKDVAYSVGFPDQMYFSRVFKKINGKTPTQFREMFVQKNARAAG